MIDRRFYQYTGPIQGRLWLGLLSKLLAFLALPFLYLLLAEALAQVLRPGSALFFPEAWGLSWRLLLALGALGLRHVLLRHSQRSFAELSLGLQGALRRAILERAFQVEARHSLSSAERLALASDGIGHMEAYFSRYLSQFYYCLISSVVLLSIYWQLSWKLALVLFLLSLLVPFLLAMALPQIGKVQSSYWDAYTSLGALFLDSLRGMSTLLIYRADERRNIEINSKAEAFRVKTMRLLRAQLNSITVIDWIAYGGAVTGIAMSLAAFQRGELSLVLCLFSLLMVAEFFLPMQALSSAFHVAMTGASTGRKILAYLEEAPEPSPGSLDFPSPLAIEAKALSFAYPDGTKALDQVSLTLADRGLYAFVGRSGCGKSTFAKLLARLAEGQVEGALLVGSIPYTKIKETSYRRSVRLVSQASQLFCRSVRENLRLAKPEASDEELIQVLEALALWEDFASREGLDTQIEANHQNISGGQAQRLSLARALLQPAKLLIADEVCANVDQESEAVILEALDRLAMEQTVLHISHRLDSIRHAKQIFVFDEGRLVEEGRFDELLALDGLFAALYEEQARLLGRAGTRKEHVHAAL